MQAGATYERQCSQCSILLAEEDPMNYLVSAAKQQDAGLALRLPWTGTVKLL